MRRRAFLAAVGAAGLAGCVGETAPADPDGTTTGAPTTGSTATGRTAAESTATGRTTTGAPTGTTPALFPAYETTEVRVTTPGGDLLGSVTAAIADTYELRYTGLSDTDALPEDRGMLFVYDEVGEHTYVMREMDFGIDIVYADDEGTITRIHRAPAPGPGEDGEDQEYPGRGQYVLEVTYEWTTERGVETGDVLRFDL